MNRIKELQEKSERVGLAIDEIGELNFLMDDSLDNVEASRPERRIVPMAFHFDALLSALRAHHSLLEVVDSEVTEGWSLVRYLWTSMLNDEVQYEVQLFWCAKTNERALVKSGDHGPDYELTFAVLDRAKRRGI